VPRETHAGTRYQFRINEDLILPDSASFFQPDDVGAPSEVIDTATLRDPILYPGRPWAEIVICCRRQRRMRQAPEQLPFT
jgi:maltooligosyltrehalose trehalohydrolase